VGALHRAKKRLNSADVWVLVWQAASRIKRASIAVRALCEDH
jgi:hypothetical protein